MAKMTEDDKSVLATLYQNREEVVLKYLNQMLEAHQAFGHNAFDANGDLVDFANEGGFSVVAKETVVFTEKKEKYTKAFRELLYETAERFDLRHEFH